MVQQVRETQAVEFTTDLPATEGVCFDPETITLHGLYSDELSLFRAKRIWSLTLEETFLLERDRDFRFELQKDYDNSRFVMGCTFLTACGRYAFWRLTNNQAPEAQYEIETAHIPDSLSRHDDFVSAPDLKPLSPTALTLGAEWDGHAVDSKSFGKWLQEVLEKITKSF